MRVSVSKCVISGAVAAVAVAGSANAGFYRTVLDTFGDTYTATGSATATTSGTTTTTNTTWSFVAGANPPVSASTVSYSGWTNWGGTATPSSSSKNFTGNVASSIGSPYANFSSITEGGGALQLIANTNATPSTAASFSPAITYRADTNVSGTIGPKAFNFAGKGDHFYFENVTNASDGKWEVRVRLANDITGTGATYYQADITSGFLQGPTWLVPFTALERYVIGANGTSVAQGDYFNLADANKIGLVSVGRRLTGAYGNGNVSTMTEFGIVPAPGAITLLAMAGFAGGRRRRA